MTMPTNTHRRRLLGAATASLAAAGFTFSAQSASAQRSAGTSLQALPQFGSLKQINVGVLDVGYAEAGPPSGPPVVLLHGWPYDIHTFVDVAPLLAASSYRVVPSLWGYGTTRFVADDAPRNGQQSALAADVIAVMDALAIPEAVIGGFD